MNNPACADYDRVSHTHTHPYKHTALKENGQSLATWGRVTRSHASPTPRPPLVRFHSSAQLCRRAATSGDFTIAQTALRAVVLSPRWIWDVWGLLLLLFAGEGLFHQGEVDICHIGHPPSVLSLWRSLLKGHFTFSFSVHHLVYVHGTPVCFSRLRPCRPPSTVGNTLTMDMYLTAHTTLLQKKFLTIPLSVQKLISDDWTSPTREKSNKRCDVRSRESSFII